MEKYDEWARYKLTKEDVEVRTRNYHPRHQYKKDKKQIETIAYRVNLGSNGMRFLDASSIDFL